MIPKATAAARAAASAKTPATITSWNAPEDLVRIARGESAGTQVLPG
jgi:acetylglutamate kinase